jgi:hypothetical protein
MIERFNSPRGPLHIRGLTKFPDYGQVAAQPEFVEEANARCRLKKLVDIALSGP